MAARSLINHIQYIRRRRRPCRPEAAPRWPGPPGSRPAGSALAKGLAGIGRPGSAGATSRAGSWPMTPRPGNAVRERGWRIGVGSPASGKVSASCPTIFQLVLLIIFNISGGAEGPAGQKPPPVGQDHQGLGPPDRRWPWCRTGSDARGQPGRGGEEGAGRRSRAPETPSERGRGGSDHVAGVLSAYYHLDEVPGMVLECTEMNAEFYLRPFLGMGFPPTHRVVRPEGRPWQRSRSRTLPRSRWECRGGGNAQYFIKLLYILFEEDLRQ